jgi:hypothetical protein
VLTVLTEEKPWVLKPKVFSNLKRSRKSHGSLTRHISVAVVMAHFSAAKDSYSKLANL